MIENIDVLHHPVISPNPEKDMLEISIPNDSWKKGHYALYDVLGRFMYKNKWDSQTSAMSTKINLEFLHRRVYFFVMKKESGEFYVSKLIKE